ncbi:SWIM-type domain-containing protein [Heracleum sosnowskyi]|uniref:SWIM-type domain-containing protein n=1 Tax=Heracleum sosnowskyi TaxID=360622 RepID=A0AAD8N6Z4_9APIA|nr:SWIM-type domain-containing protein [Heracleum sosnowskyi]
MICNELKLQPESTFVKIEYHVKDGYPPFKIVDDLHINFYIELKKKEANFTIYPLCVTTENRDIQISAYSNGSGLTSNDEGMSSNTSYNNSDAVSKEVVEDYVDYAEHISRQMLDMSPEPTTEDEIIEISKDDVINNRHNQELSALQIYKDKETLQIVLSLYAIRNNFQYKVKKSCKNQYLVECLDKNCNWLLRASRNGNTNQFVIRRMVDSHTCSLEIRFKDKRQATTNVIADVIKHKFSNIKTKYSVTDIIRDMKHDHNVEVKYNKAWRSKEKALEIMRGNATESFVELYSYLYMLYTTNVGSVVELQLTRNNCFLYVFVALNSSMKGWNYCLPVVVVDGAFLKSSYRGTLLVAATQDAGGKIFPVAFGVVDSENDMSWEWFFEKFRIAYGRREDMVIVSDRHESIIKGAKKIYPEVPNVFCIFHLLGNIKSKFKKNLKKIKDAFFSAANAYSVTKFQYHMKELEKVDKTVQVYLEDVGYEKWAKVYSGNNRYSNMTSNVAESLNSVTMSIRELPICTMLESQRALIQKWSWRNRNEANATSTRLTRKYEELLKKNYLLSVDLTVNPTNHILFEVLNGDKKNVVDLNAKSCIYYKKETMVAAYKETVYPVGNRDTWEVPQTVKSLIVNPPEGRIRVGRPKKRRCKASWERNGKTLKPIICGKCKQSGHNRRSCRNPVKND